MPVARELHAEAAPLSVAAVEVVRAGVPELFADAESVEENRASTEASIRAFAGLVCSGAAPDTVDLPLATIEYARASVRRGDSLTALMRSYRLASEVAFRAIFERIAERCTDQEQLHVAGQLVGAWLFGYMDAALGLAERLYEDERSRWLRSAAASQAETIEALLEGRGPDLQQASARLRYELDRHHVAAFAWLDGAESTDPLTALEAAVAQVAAAAHADAVLVQPLGMRAVAAWLGRVERFDDQAFAGLRIDAAAAPGVHLAIGEPGAGLAGFRASHGEAAHARRVATLSARRPGAVTRFGRVALLAMATADVDQARAFVSRELGELAADDDVARRLAATLRVYLDENASRSRAAKRLNIHDNTVSYRVRQAQELLGRRVDERSLELRVALALHSALPPA